MSYVFPSAESVRDMLVPDLALLEVVIRVSAVYLILFFVLRFVLKRELAALGVSDLLLVVLLADGVQNGMSGDYTSISDAIAIGLTLVFWNYALDYLGYRFPRIQRVVKPPPLELIRNGRLDRRAARRELLTHDEIMAQLRAQGLSRIEDVEVAYMEATGEITAVPKQGSAPAGGKGKRRKPGVP